jgi:hypothetical protein
MTKPLRSVIVERAREILADPKRWCRGARAKNKEERSVSVADEGAVMFCAIGAIERAIYERTGELDPEKRENIMWEITYAIQGGKENKYSLLAVNDGMAIGICAGRPVLPPKCGREGILDMFDAALNKEVF